MPIKKEQTIKKPKSTKSPLVEPKESQSADPLVQVLIILSVIIATVAIYFMMTSEGSEKTKYGVNPHQSSTWSNVGGNFALVDTDGKHFLSAKLRGRPNLIYFGFTFCPDICPTELNKMSRIMDLVEKDKIDILPVFITIDPKRDTYSLMKTYLGNFNKKFVGLTGTEEQVKKVADMFNVYYEKALPENDPKAELPENKNYMVNHTAYIYLLDKYGRFVRFFDTSSTAEEIAGFIHENLVD